jgi:hypothetical protein
MAEIKQGAQAQNNEEMGDWQGKFGGSVDGWWAPPEDKETHTLKGVLVNFISKDRSDKLQSNSLVFELIEECDGCKNGGSEKMPGQKDDKKLHKAPVGCTIGVPEWKQLEGMWPGKAGHKVFITRSGEKRSIGKGRSMYDIKVQMSKGAVRHVDVYEEDTDGGGMAPAADFQVETTA